MTLTDRQLDLLIQACEAHFEAATEDSNYTLADEWETLRALMEEAKGGEKDD